MPEISIRARLLLILISLSGLVWLSGAAWIYLSTQARIERVLDARLAQAASMVSSLIESSEFTPVRADARGPALSLADTRYDRQLSCQIWSLDGDLIGRSEGAPDQSLAGHANGFEDTIIDGQPWRVYAELNPGLGVRVLVGDNLGMRRRLVDNIALGLFAPALLMLPVFVVLIWWSVGRGLKPLDELARILSKRNATDLSPIAVTAPPRELRSAVNSLDNLFARVGIVREREREFIAYAAHELRTPLAGLKIQAQVARSTNEDAVRRRALDNILGSVDRSARLIDQLLKIARLEADEIELAIEDLSLTSLLDVILADLRGEIARKELDVRLEIAPDAASIRGDSYLLDIILRNVLENAVRYSPHGGTVQIRAVSADDAVRMEFINRAAAGLSTTDLDRAFDRFYRASAQSAGSGLGLSLARLAAKLLSATLTIAPADRPDEVLVSLHIPHEA
jgi:two-component system sensor histidine kinase QseC